MAVSTASGPSQRGRDPGQTKNKSIASLPTAIVFVDLVEIQISESVKLNYSGKICNFSTFFPIIIVIAKKEKNHSDSSVTAGFADERGGVD